MGSLGDIEAILSNYTQVVDGLEKKKNAAEKAVKRTVSDFKSRGPGWISSAVTDTYTIKKAEVKAAISAKKKAGAVNVGGIPVDNVQIEYSGRLLTPTHFKMKPTKVPTKRAQGYRRVPGAGVGEGGSAVAMVQPQAPYSVTQEVYKGKRRRLSKKAFVGSNGSGTALPFQRSGDGRLPVESIKTVSIPQMITNETVAAQISENIDGGLTSRLHHHLEQELSKG